MRLEASSEDEGDNHAAPAIDVEAAALIAEQQRVPVQELRTKWTQEVLKQQKGKIFEPTTLSIFVKPYDIRYILFFVKPYDIRYIFCETLRHACIFCETLRHTEFNERTPSQCRVSTTCCI